MTLSCHVGTLTLALTLTLGAYFTLFDFFDGVVRPLTPCRGNLDDGCSRPLLKKKWKDARSRDVWTEKQQDQDAIHQAVSPILYTTCSNLIADAINGVLGDPCVVNLWGASLH